MRFKLKLKLSILILFVPVGFIALLQIIALNVLFITDFSKTAKQLSFQLYNETILMQIKQRTLTLNSYNRFAQTSAFVLQEVLMSQLQKDFSKSLPQTIQFINPLLRKNFLENIIFECSDGFFYSKNPTNQSNSNFSWKEYDYLKVEVKNLSFWYTLNFYSKFDCLIEILQPVSIIQSQHTYFEIQDKAIENFNFAVVESEFYQVDSQNFAKITKEQLEKITDVVLDDLLDKKNFNGQKCPYHEITVISNEQLIFGIFMNFFKYPFSCLHQTQKLLAVIKILKNEELASSINKVVIDSDFNIYIIMVEGLIGVIFLIYVYLISIRISNSFYGPLYQLKLQLENPQCSNLQCWFGQQDFACKEVKELVQSCSNCILGYQLLSKNSQFIGNDQGTQKLLDLAQLQQFYKHFKNIWQMSVCSNNIAQIHFYNKRYVEALKFQAQSLVLGFEEYTSIKQIEKIRKQLIQSERNILLKLKDRLKRFVINKFAGSTYIIQSEGFQKNRFCSFNQNQNSLYKFTEAQNIQNSERFTKMNIKSNLNSLDRICDSQRDIFLNNEHYSVEKMFYKITLFYRKYQFSSMLYKFCIKKQTSFLNESIESLSDLYDEISFSKYSHQTSITVMKINLLIMKFDCYRKLALFEQAQDTMSVIKLLYSKYRLSEKVQFVFNGFDIFEQIDDKTLKNLIRKAKAILLFEFHDYSQAGQKCAKILKMNTQNIKSLNKFAFKTLMKIFEINNLNLNVLQNHYLKIKTKQIKALFLMDYSSEISLEQIQLSHSLTSYIIFNILNIQEIGLFTFNETLFEIIRSNNIQRLKLFLDQQLKQFFIKKGSNCKLMQNVLKIFKNYMQFKQKSAKKQKLIRKSLSFELNLFKESNYLFVFSEFSIALDSYLMNQINLYQDLTKFRLVIINIANSNKNIELSKLFAQNVNAIYIENENELQKFIENLNQIYYPIMKQGYYEYF